MRAPHSRHNIILTYMVTHGHEHAHAHARGGGVSASWGHPPLPGRRHPPPGRCGSPPPHQPALRRPSGSPARPDGRAPLPQRGVDAENRRPLPTPLPLAPGPSGACQRAGSDGERWEARGCAWEGGWTRPPSPGPVHLMGPASAARGARGAHLAKRQSRASGGRGGRRGG